MEDKNINEEMQNTETADEKLSKSEKKELVRLTEENKKLAEELEKAKAELVAGNDKYLRMIAEYDNFRKRTGKERDALYADAYGDALTAILPVIDNLERALSFSEGEALTEGVRMTLRQFEDAMKRLGVEAYGARGDDFDPRIHNAIMQVDDDTLGESKVAEVLQKGYAKGERIIRHAMVKVAN